MSSSGTLKGFEKPPINEVICGFIFEPMAVDALDFGVYWEARRNEFPIKELHPPLINAPVGNEHMIQVAASSAMRAWLISNEEDLILQLQHDRFYLNWRAKEHVYPRFSDQQEGRGLKSRAIMEWERFASFLNGRTGTAVRLSQIELAKVDVLPRGKYWSDFADLGKLMKVAKVFQDIQVTEPNGLLLRLTEGDAAETAVVTVAMGKGAVRLETRVIAQMQPGTSGEQTELAQALTRANERLNRLFLGLMDHGEMCKRFGAEGG